MTFQVILDSLSDDKIKMVISSDKVCDVTSIGAVYCSFQSIVLFHLCTYIYMFVLP